MYYSKFSFSDSIFGIVWVAILVAIQKREQKENNFWAFEKRCARTPRCHLQLKIIFSHLIIVSPVPSHVHCCFGCHRLRFLFFFLLTRLILSFFGSASRHFSTHSHHIPKRVTAHKRKRRREPKVDIETECKKGSKLGRRGRKNMSRIDVF